MHTLLYLERDPLSAPDPPRAGEYSKSGGLVQGTFDIFLSSKRRDETTTKTTKMNPPPIQKKKFPMRE
jgi:hypothetical protein